MVYALCLMSFVFLGGFVWAVFRDMMTGSGYGLGILSCLLLALNFLVIMSVINSGQQARSAFVYTANPTLLLFLYFTPGAIAMGLMVIGAGAVAVAAGHWYWLGVLFGAVLVPALYITHPLPIWILSSAYSEQIAGLLGILILPEVIILAYSVIRVVHPALD